MKIELCLALAIAHLIVPLILKTYGFSIEMIPIDSPKLKFLPANFSEQERHKLLTSISLSRVRQRLSNNTYEPDSIIMKPYYTLGYYVSGMDIGEIAGAGTPYTAYVLLDTGSSITWIQCEGCEPCFNFEGAKFDYRVSGTYERMGINDPLCTTRKEYHGSCGFTLNYGISRDRIVQAKGMMGTDTFSFENPTDQKVEAFNRMAFGCGFENIGFDEGHSFVGPNNIISGVLGLARGSPASFMDQLDHHIKGRFSYCLPPYFRNVPHTVMYFGDDAQIRGDDTRQVQAITMITDEHYYLSMTGISVDGNRLPIDPSIFEPKPSEFKGMIIDSGAPQTTLVKTAFDLLHDALVEYFYEKFGFRPLPPDPEKLWYKLCYGDYPQDRRLYPKVIFHFKREGQEGEANMVFSMHNMFGIYKIDEPPYDNEVMCLTVLDVPDEKPSLLGAYQQTDFRFLYDSPKQLLHFLPEICVFKP